MLPRRVRRCQTLSYVGTHRYSLTFATSDRRPLFVAVAVVELCLMQILRAAADARFEITAYCFMPDHLHLLVKGQDDASNLKEFAKRAKQLSGFM